MSITSIPWDKTPTGEEVRLYTLNNNEGYTACVATYGATLTKLVVPVSNGQSLDVILGFNDLNGYLNDAHYCGSTIGRTAGRISQAEFELDGKKFSLDKNEGENQLHGGLQGFHSRIWTAFPENGTEGPTLKLCYYSPDGESGYPGNLSVTVTYALIKNGLRIVYSAETDKPTPVNMTAHPYFNLDDNGKNIGSHKLKIFSSTILELDKNMIPTGKRLDVADTDYDFTDFFPINRSEEDDIALGNTVKYDQFYILDSKNKELHVVAIARSGASGLELEIASTQSGLQFYSGDYISEGTVGKCGCHYGPRSGFCLEPHGYPDAPNNTEFPSETLRPGEIYVHSTEYRFREFKTRN